MRYFFSLLLLVVLANASSAQRRINVKHENNPKSGDTVPDSVVYYDENISVKQKSFKKSLEGKWEVISMRRQQKASLETFADVFIVFGADSSFSGKAPCNIYGGVYILKGTGIHFSQIVSTMIACDNLDQEKAFLDLLQNRVSAFTVIRDTLLLRDGASNIVFECRRLAK
jgi:heat shock protein HslJ